LGFGLGFWVGVGFEVCVGVRLGLGWTSSRIWGRVQGFGVDSGLTLGLVWSWVGLCLGWFEFGIGYGVLGWV